MALVAWCVQAIAADAPRVVVLTFDDAVASHHSVVRPLLKEFGFGATFFITEGFMKGPNRGLYLTWEQVADLHRDGFEIGNHTVSHLGVGPGSLNRLEAELQGIVDACARVGVPKPISFAWPGNALTPAALPILQKAGLRWGRRGGQPEFPYEWGMGTAYEPGVDHPLLIPSAADARPDWTLADFRRGIEQAGAGKIAVIQFHGVPDIEHPWVHTDPKRFRAYLEYLRDQRFTVVALRDLDRFIPDPTSSAEDPLAITRARIAARVERPVDVTIKDSATGKPTAVRVTIQSADGRFFFPKSTSLTGGAVRYERRNGSNTNAFERHTTLSAHPFKVELPPGRYALVAERGKEYFPERATFEVGTHGLRVELGMRRWVNMPALGWYSGDGHHHRDPLELASAQLAEDVHVALPMMDWTTVDSIPPATSPRSFPTHNGPEQVVLDPTHVWLPRNSEYEIFQSGGRNHTLGAFLVLNHKGRLEMPVFPLSNVVVRARADGALIDLEKHNWPWSMLVVPLLEPDLFELANNHHWQTEYASRNWAVPAPSWMRVPGNGSGTDTEDAWTDYGFQTYYTLLNAGFRIKPSAGTANGVHPVPLGFSRVYVRLDGPFSANAWFKGLGEGRSFVTTGPMIMATLGGRDYGSEVEAGGSSAPLTLTGEVLSEQPVSRIEVIVDGEVTQSIPPANEVTSSGAYATRIDASIKGTGRGWVGLRCYEPRDGGRQRFAHSAPWWLLTDGQRPVPRRQAVERLMSAARSEYERTHPTLGAAGRADYELALQRYQALLERSR